MFKSWQYGKKYFLTLWGAAMLIALLIMTMDFWDRKADIGFLKNQELSVNQPTAEDINELLLSSHNLQLEEKKDFINLYLLLKSDSNYEGSLAIENQRNTIYKNIFNRKLDRLEKGKKSQTDFSIRPVPK